MATAGSVVIDLLMRTGAFETDSKRAEKRLREMGKTAKQAGIAIGAAVAGAGTALALGVKNAIDFADELSKMSQRTGISVEALSRLEVAASQSDTSLESLQKAMVNLGRAQLEAREGTEDQVALFKALGIESQELEDLAPDALLKRIADAFKATADSPEKAAVAVKLFGKAGAELIPMLNGGSEQLERFDRLSDELGNTLSTETALAAAEFNDKIDLLRIGFNGVWREAATNLLPTLDKLAADFNDPRFREGFTSLVEGAVGATTAVAGLLAELGNLTQWAGEEVAARINGPDRGDIARLEQQRDRLQAELDNIVVDVPAMFNVLGLGRRDVLSKEISEAEKLIEDYWENIAQMGAQVAPEPEAAEAGTAPGIDLDAWKKAMQEREAAAAAMTAARKAESTATREQARLERDAAQALRESTEASMAFQTITEDLQALLGGPLAQVQLDYIRREDELIALSELAGLSQEELAASLGLLEQARLKDVEAIEAQMEAEKAYEQALKDAPLVQRMDQLRDTTAGFFVDLVKNGEDAIDRLEDYLLTSALESIGKQIAEGLFGDYGTTGAEGNWLGSLFGSFFGGAKAGGGDVFANRPLLIGEQGPEMFIPRSAGSIIPAEQVSRMAGGGGKTVVQNIAFQLPGRYDQRTQAQIAADAGRASQRAISRSTA